jgi:hypothetical protein
MAQNTILMAQNPKAAAQKTMLMAQGVDNYDVFLSILWRRN